ncbi:NAD+ synthase (glutamine-hydrolyzing) [Lachnospiraceae bacterium PFB1-21]
MKDGFVKVACVTPEVRVADVGFNVEETIKRALKAGKAGAKVIVFPELNLTSYTCGDLFFQERLLRNAREGLIRVAEATKSVDALLFVGLPLAVEGELYNVAAALNHGRILGFVTKSFLPNYGEFYEMRQFAEGPSEPREIVFEGEVVPLGTKLLFCASKPGSLIIGAEICEDLWSPIPPSIEMALEGATVIANLSASNELVGKEAYREELVKGQAARIICGYLYANAGSGESTTDVVFGGHNLIAENGSLLAEGKRFVEGITYSEIDTKRILTERQKNTTFQTNGKRALRRIPFDIEFTETVLSRTFKRLPFVPMDQTEMNCRCEEILELQARGLCKRLRHIGGKKVVLGISGGLDSTLALMVVAKAFDYLELDKKGIIAITMPAFGTTDRTYQNACELVKGIGATLREINIKEAVLQHFADINQDPELHDVTYENSQARERTQVLMDVANQEGGLVIGTGDMSELALGWATYNGDHMSMYGVNASIPKTLVRHLVTYYAGVWEDEKMAKVLLDIVDTPVSPELIPAKDGEIVQKTEDLVGPYELHDFFLYYFLRFGYDTEKILRIAKLAFAGEYEEETIRKWLKIFTRRFFSQQFKRSCLPDGVKVGSVALSPRGDWRMPSDAVSDGFSI